MLHTKVFYKVLPMKQSHNENNCWPVAH